MSAYKEIVTKMVIGKGKKFYKSTYTLVPEIIPSTVLGCWVINHKFKGKEENDKIVIDGSFDVNIWYSYDDDTRTTVVSQTINYNEVVSINQREITDSTKKDVIVRSLNGPTCTSTVIKDDNIEYVIEKELGIEIVGDSKIKIAIEEDEEPWDIITDEEFTEDVEKEIDDSVREDYLKEN